MGNGHKGIHLECVPLEKLRAVPVREALQPHVAEAAIPCAQGCNPMCPGLQPHASQAPAKMKATLMQQFDGLGPVLQRVLKTVTLLEAQPQP